MGGWALKMTFDELLGHFIMYQGHIFSVLLVHYICSRVHNRPGKSQIIAFEPENGFKCGEMDRYGNAKSANLQLFWQLYAINMLKIIANVIGTNTI